MPLSVYTVTCFGIIFHRRVAEGAESIYFSFAARRAANKKKVYLCVLCDFAVKQTNHKTVQDAQGDQRISVIWFNLHDL
jgi:hypothetical protein